MMNNNNDDWIDLFELAVGWGNRDGLVYFELFGPGDNIRVHTILYRQIIRRLSYKIMTVKDYRTSGEPTERVLYTNIPSQLFKVKRNTTFAIYDDKIYDVSEEEDEEQQNNINDTNNDDPI